MTYQEKVLKYVLSKGGEMIFTEFQFGEVEPFVKLRAVVFTEQYNNSLDAFDGDDPNEWNWNKYCNRIREASGSKHYCVRVGWPKNIKGIIVAYDKKGNEVKLKYFEDFPSNWKQLYKHIKNE